LGEFQEVVFVDVAVTIGVEDENALGGASQSHDQGKILPSKSVGGETGLSGGKKTRKSQIRPFGSRKDSA
jgi:hypothetical protein